ncbi:hypothetical protein IAE57_06865 [Stenotrophomonas sp. S48]|uniref:hypothetical protein n=1 Tax=unclassified Stenotrophomonas TaxID=196198 RepID=UPI0019015E0E|nr:MULTISPECIES: hypothetical protein [unclassified Stenotrophomonas]MBK0025876.1 hypothetical protein [Stenotrophomonas sp. S48]MBK0047987.1 hypothetical protein [Stenotrophomonas sp. S49]
MAIALIALMLIELLLLFAWAPLFFRTGIMLFNQRIAAAPDDLKRLSLGGLEYDLPTERWARLAFRALPDGSVAFRESFVPGFGGRYFPLLHGQIVVDTRRREVRVLGRCSWFATVLTVLLVPIVLLRPVAWPILAVPLLFYIGYRIQRRRYANVVEAVRARVRNEFPWQFKDPPR